MRLGEAPTVVAFGGGHGLSASLSALRQITHRLTAVVTVADDGGSSGRLRREFPILPPGDLRMALAALCGDDQVGRAWAEVLQSRFRGDGPLGGHAIGNLLIAGLWQQLEDPVAGLDMVAAMLHVEGRVLPMAAVPLTIEADVVGLDAVVPDGIKVVSGQEQVALAQGEILGIRLVPRNPPAVPQALQAIAEAEYLVLGPGSWFSSVLPHLMVPELLEAILSSPAFRILTLNLTATDDETPAYSASRHLEVLADCAPALRFDAILVDPTFAAGDRYLSSYAQALGADLVVEPVRMRDGSARHDPFLLAAAYAGLMNR